MIEDEEKIQSNQLEEACRLVSLTEDVFIASLQYYMEDPFVK